MNIQYSYVTQQSNHSQMDIRDSIIKCPSNDISKMDIRRRICDIRISNIHLTTSQMDIQYSNIKLSPDEFQDGYLIFDILKFNI